MDIALGRKDAPLSDQAARAWLTLLRAPGVGNKTLLPLLAVNSDPAHWLENPGATEVPERLRSWLAAPDQGLIDKDLAWLAAEHHHLLVLPQPGYPELLRDTPEPPAALFIIGDPELLSLPQVAIVGSRTPTTGGHQAAHDFAAYLAGKGLVITSGLALGIDGASHQGALDAAGRTLAVTGTGLDRVYPARHRDLAHAIVAGGGALVSEFLPGTPPRSGHFPRRNRIISGLALGTLVVEAALQSGSLITARQALEQGREVFAIPGSIHNPMAKGCHALIRDGAKLVETGQHVIEELGAMLGGLAETPLSTAVSEAHSETHASASREPRSRLQDPDYQTVLKAMGYDPVSVDSLVLTTGKRAEEISSMMLLLELEGHVSSSPGGLFARTGKPSD